MCSDYNQKQYFPVLQLAREVLSCRRLSWCFSCCWSISCCWCISRYWTSCSCKHQNFFIFSSEKQKLKKLKISVVFMWSTHKTPYLLLLLVFKETEKGKYELEQSIVNKRQKCMCNWSYILLGCLVSETNSYESEFVWISVWKIFCQRPLDVTSQKKNDKFFVIGNF